jgi:hypothetical protein
MRFRADVAGSIIGVRFYKAAANTGTHIGNLWTNTGARLATVTFSNETASGWQEADFSTPVAISANTTYVVSYYAPAGHYSDTGKGFTTSVDNAPLHGLADGFDGGNGAYVYGADGFPTGTYNSSNYWVDLVFAVAYTTGPVISTVVANPGIGGTASITWTTDSASTSRVDYGTSATSLTLNASSSSLVTPHAINLTGLTQGTTYYYRVTSVDASGNSTTSPVTANSPNSFIENAISVWSSTTVPSTVDSGDGSAVELGVKFQSTTSGNAIGIRFYKSGANTGTHIGHLWTRTGTLLTTVTFTGETASGWQQAFFSTPVAISANTTYIISYYAPLGHYSNNGAYFATSGAINAPLQALANGSDGSNGVYIYGTSAFPTQSYNSSNYWVDVIFH